MSDLWQRCLAKLEEELTSQQYNTWIRPLAANEKDGQLQLGAPNRFVLDWVRDKYWPRIVEFVAQESGGATPVQIVVLQQSAMPETAIQTTSVAPAEPEAPTRPRKRPVTTVRKDFSFDNFIEGKSNQLARAASIQVGENPGKSYNPLFICGGVGLGKTHLMHAVGNHILLHRPNAKVAYLHSERFVGDMVRALQHNTINEFKK